MDSTALYYFFSTIAQSAAALLGILVTGYVFSESVFGAECREGINEIWPLFGQDEKFSGTVHELIERSTALLLDLNNKFDKGEISVTERAGQGKRLTHLESSLSRLRRAQKQLEAGRLLPKAFPAMMVEVFVGIAALPFVPEMAGWPWFTYPVVFLTIIVWAYFFFILHRLSKRVFDRNHDI